MIGNGRGLQNELRKLANELPKDGDGMHIIFIKELRDKFTLHASNTTNNSVNFHTQQILPVSTTADSSHHTCPAGREKSKDEMTNE